MKSVLHLGSEGLVAYQTLNLTSVLTRRYGVTVLTSSTIPLLRTEVVFVLGLVYKHRTPNGVNSTINTIESGSSCYIWTVQN
jgi:hypothetical protein